MAVLIQSFANLFLFYILQMGKMMCTGATRSYMYP